MMNGWDPIYLSRAKGITISDASAELNVSAEKQLVASVNPSDAIDTRIIWSSSKSDIASVDNSGKVIALSLVIQLLPQKLLTVDSQQHVR